jgi:hypothetical protein
LDGFEGELHISGSLKLKKGRTFESVVARIREQVDTFATLVEVEALSRIWDRVTGGISNSGGDARSSLVRRRRLLEDGKTSDVAVLSDDGMMECPKPSKKSKV